MGICLERRNKRKNKLQNEINFLNVKITETELEMEGLFKEINDLKEQLEQTNNGGSLEFDRENKEKELEEKIDDYNYLELIKDDYKSNLKKLENAKRDKDVENVINRVNKAYKDGQRKFEVIDDNNLNKRKQEKESDIWRQKLKEGQRNENNGNPYERREKIKDFFKSKK
jgi:chromosome segregation ATPase